jgi:hypothetical protein
MKRFLFWPFIVACFLPEAQAQGRLSGINNGEYLEDQFRLKGTNNRSNTPISEG